MTEQTAPTPDEAKTEAAKTHAAQIEEAFVGVLPEDMTPADELALALQSIANIVDVDADDIVLVRIHKHGPGERLVDVGYVDGRGVPVGRKVTVAYPSAGL